MTVRVLLVDDHNIMRQGLASLLAGEKDIDVVAQASTGGEALEQVAQEATDLVVMDLNLPDLGGIQVIRQIRAAHPAINVLVLSMQLDRSCVLESLEAGAKGYLAKDCAAEELVTAIRTVSAGKAYLSRSATEIVLETLAAPPATPHQTAGLTPRELQVLKLTAEGCNTKEIAFTLGVSVKMIEVHRKNLRRKLGLKSIAQLATYAVRTNLISV